MGGCCTSDRDIPAPIYARNKSTENPPTPLASPSKSPSITHRRYTLDSDRRRQSVKSMLDESTKFLGKPGDLLSEIGTFVPVKRFLLTIDDVYQVLTETEAGPGVTLYLARHQKTSQIQLIRKMHWSEGGGFKRNRPGRDEALKEEVVVLHGLDHPGILKIQEVLSNKADIFAVSDVVHGDELVSWNDLAACCSEDVIASVIAQILQALRYCHARHVHHNNLSFRSVLFLRSGTRNVQAKITGFEPVLSLPSPDSSPIGWSSVYMSPESKHGFHSEKSDIWSCGIMLYQLLTGDADVHRRLATMDKLLEDRLENSLLTQESASLIKGMLLKDPFTRLSACECIAHPWIQRCVSRTNIDPKSLKLTLNKLRMFKSESQLKLSMLTFILEHVIDDVETTELTSAFAAIDTDCDGVISKTELATAYSKAMPAEFAAVVAEDVIQSIGRGMSGTVSYSEFMVAAFDQEILLAPSKLKTVFKLFERDEKGKVGVDQLIEMVKGTGNQRELERTVWEVEGGGEIGVDFKGFVEVVRRAVGGGEAKRRGSRNK